MQPLTITATSSNPALVPAPTLDYFDPDSTGTLTFTPTANVSGSATIAVTVNDGQAQNNLITRSFTVTVSAVNDAPTLDPIADLQLAEDAPTQSVALAGIGTGAANETQTLSVTALSSNPGLIPNPTVSYTSPNAGGTITFKPLTNASGSAVITVTLNDGQAQNNLATRSFTVTVNEVNDTPTLNIIGNVTISEDAGIQTISLAGISPEQPSRPRQSPSLPHRAIRASSLILPSPTTVQTPRDRSPSRRRPMPAARRP